ncbi:MAG: hypothetical protein EOM20_02535 [Spartobacteria bacterium]|nr:hypothetical protein [Spartobacteria bacterium]
METFNTKQPDSPPSSILREMEDLLRRLGQLLNNAALYGPLHNLTRQSMMDSYKYLTSVLQHTPRINISITEGKLFVDGDLLESTNSFVNIFINKLIELNITGFTFCQGMPLDEYTKLTGLILSGLEFRGERKDFSALLQDMNFSYVQSEKVSYRRVTDGDVVIAANEVSDNEEETAEESLFEFVEANEPEPVSPPVIEIDESTVVPLIEIEEPAPVVEAPAPPVETPPVPSVSQIMAFLKGEVNVDKITEELSEIANDAEQLAQLIMDAAAIRQRNLAIDEGESLGDLVVGCLRRTFEGLMTQPASKSMQGKKNLKKTMLLLEKTVLEKLQAMTGERDEGLESMISDGVEVMVDEVEIDSLATEYMKRRRAMEKTEKRMMRYLKAKTNNESADSVLQNRLYAAGMTPNGWQELMVKKEEHRGVGSGPGRSGDEPGIPGGMGALAVLLAELDDLMSAAGNSDSIGQKASAIEEEVERIAEGTEEKIEALGSEFDQIKKMLVGVQEFEASRETMPQHEFRELLAEIVQELCQPLSATNCAVNMTLGGHVGELNSKQQEVLGVASKCGHRLDKLLERMKEIVGMPKGLKPAKEKLYDLSSTTCDTGVHIDGD